LHGLAQGDFDLALRGLLGEAAPLSAPSIARLKTSWQAEYETWKHQGGECDGGRALRLRRMPMSPVLPRQRSGLTQKWFDRGRRPHRLGRKIP